MIKINSKFLLAIFTALLLPISFVYSQAQKKIILWDIQGVILSRDVKKTLHVIWDYNNKKNLFKQFNGNLFKGSCSFLWRYMTNQTAVAEYIELAQLENNPYLADLVLQLASAYKPIYGTWEIIKELYELGYAQHIASNISEHAFKELNNMQRFPTIAPIFSYFDLRKPQIISVRKTEPKIIQKPSRQFFEEYLANNSIDIKTTRVIFIDDDRENIITASSMGFLAILFNNPEQLRTDLRSIGVELQENPIPLFGI